jgi:CheY-like chemotaxis protein
MRVIVASEYPEVQHFFRDVVEDEGGTVISEQVKNAARALALTRKYRPDVAIIDSCLPHVVGLDTVLLSRTGGLDVAQTISNEMPNMKVILVSNPEIETSSDYGLNPDVATALSMARMGVDTPFTLQELCCEVGEPNALVFANVQAKPRASLRQKVASLSGTDVLFGSLVTLGGLSLVFALAAAGAWLLLALAGAAVIGAGIGLLWNRIRPQKSRRRSS